MSWVTISSSVSTSSAPPIRRRRVVDAERVPVALPAGRPRRRGAGALSSSAMEWLPFCSCPTTMTGSICPSGRYWKPLSYQLLEPFAGEFVRGIGLPADVADDAVAATNALADLVHGDAERLAGGEAASHDRRAVRPHHHAMRRPARRGEVQRGGAHVCLQLGGPALVREAEGLRVHRTPPNKNGQATSGPAVLVERRIDVDNEALTQA